MRASAELRLQVSGRADHRCEYCRLHEDDAAFPHEVDHIISRQHRGGDELDNLAYSCMLCNRSKGTNLSSIDSSGRVVRLFDPRADRWHSHFRLEGAVIQPITGQGTATATLLRMNAAERVMERNLLQGLGRYPRI